METINVKIREAVYMLRHRARETLLSSSMGYAHREHSAFSMVVTPITLILLYMNKIYFIELSITI